MRKLLALIPVAFFGLVIICGMGLGDELFSVASLLPGNDKTAHVILSFVITVALNYSLSLRRVLVFSQSALAGCVVIFLFLTCEELSQIFIESRTFSLLDLAANYTGIYLASHFS